MTETVYLLGQSVFVQHSVGYSISGWVGILAVTCSAYVIVCAQIDPDSGRLDHKFRARSCL